MSALPVEPRRVVVTGLGLACALGLDPPTYWRRLVAGECGIRHRAPSASSDQLPVKIAGVIADDELAAAARRDGLREPDRSNLLALYVAGRALADAGLATDGAHPHEMDVIVGSGHGNIALSNQMSIVLHREGYRKVRPTTVLRVMFNRPANLVSIRYRLTGGSHVVSCACATATIAFGEAFHRIRFGLADQALAASADTGLDDGTFAAWNRLGVLSKIPDPERASRPFDRGRDGLVISEGAAAFVLESLDSARARAARPYAEVLGYSVTSDAAHLVHPQSEGQVRALRRALAAAELSPADIDFVSAHGAATDVADPVEAASLREVFGAHAERMPVSTTKGQLGHLMGATAGVELLTMILVLQHGLIPPCRNLDDPDPRCALSFVRGAPLKMPVTTALKNCFAFGGTNSVVILRRWDEPTSRR
jgi:3-oxoacyl-[acyl-carrier-protein] synthase II